MRRLSRTIPRVPTAALLLAAVAVAGVAAVARAAPRATLVTVGPGDAVWEQFGHNMVRLIDPDSGFDACYNWGLFDFDQPHFVANFVRGRMLYSMGALSTQRLLDEYHDQHRRVTEQPLLLTAAQLHDLIVRCETNRRPENAQYRYDYFKDNCSTRVRDLLDGVTGGAIGRVTRGRPVTPEVTFRSQTVRLMQGDFWVSLGTDFAMGPAGDTPLDAWADEFLPERVSVDAAAAGVAGPATPLWSTDRAPEPAAPPTRWPGLLATGAALAAVILGLSRWRPWAGRAAAGGVVGRLGRRRGVPGLHVGVHGPRGRPREPKPLALLTARLRRAGGAAAAPATRGASAGGGDRRGQPGRRGAEVRRRAVAAERGLRPAGAADQSRRRACVDNGPAGRSSGGR